MLWFDKYDRHARGAPGFLALLPIAVIAIVVGLRTNSAVSTLGGAVVAAGGPLVMAGLVRTQGLAVQSRLFDKWGGAPTSQLLLLCSSVENDALRDQRRRAAESATGVRLLTREGEIRNPRRGSELAEAAVTVLREKTRDESAFPLVSAELRRYGFERNALGVRRIGIAISGLAVSVLVVIILLTATKVIHHPTFELIIGTGVCFLSFLGWWFYPSEDRVKIASNKYATSLLDAAFTLAG